MEKKDAGTGRKRVRLTPVSIFHYYRLIYRSLLLITVLILYIRCRIQSGGSLTDLLENRLLKSGKMTIEYSIEVCGVRVEYTSMKLSVVHDKSKE